MASLFGRGLLCGVYLEFGPVFVEVKGRGGMVGRSGARNDWTSGEGWTRVSARIGGNGTRTACEDGFLELPVKLDVCTGKLADDAFTKTLVGGHMSSREKEFRERGGKGGRAAHKINTIRIGNLH